MRKQLLIASLALCLPATSAFAVDWSRVFTSGATTGSLYSTFKDRKIVYAAKDDASSFVASNGEIRGPYLEAALKQVHAQNPSLQASDMDIATAIMATPEQTAQ